MSRPFRRARPLQAAKLVAILLALPYAAAVYLGLVPTGRITTLLLVPMLALLLALVVTGEALVAAYRAATAETAVADRLRARPGYALVRAGELLLAVGGVAGVGAVVAAIPDGPMAGPGAVGLFLLVVAVGALVLLGGLARTLVELAVHRREGDRRPGFF